MSIKKKYKVVPVLEGFEKDPGEELVVGIEIRHIPLSVLQDIFQDNLEGGSLPITKKYESILYEKAGIKIDTDKLDFFIGLYSDN
jgi:hypothetical protein